jgi:hypothetical protein
MDYTFNQHKAMSLISANKFLDNETLNPTTREKILIQATDTIFSHQQSGFFDSSGNENPSIISNVVEI